MNELSILCLDACRGRVQNYAAEKAHYTDEAIRLAFQDLLGGETLTHKSWRKHKNDIYEIIEEVLDSSLPDSWSTSPFYRELVEVRNGALGDKNEFIVKNKSYLITSKFSGNHWNIDRQKLIGKRSFSLETEWFGIRVYDELERFLKGISTVAEMFEQLQSSLQRDIDSRISTAFQGADAYLPGEFNETGTFTHETIMKLVQRVRTANQRPARIVGTSVALASLSALTNSVWISEKMKDERNTTGKVSVWEGIQTVEIPQTFVYGTFDFAVQDDVLFVLPQDYKPIKLFFEGDTRALDRSEYENIDQTIDTQVQTKLGIGVVFGDLFGRQRII